MKVERSVVCEQSIVVVAPTVGDRNGMRARAISFSVVSSLLSAELPQPVSPSANLENPYRGVVVVAIGQPFLCVRS